ncbi:MAG: glutamyl-tRNA reductase [Candidatus Omnitrophota bacterium]|nr:glutamyl-tRNA reductase [Candidatus Omnitrophota bacterium]
MNLIVVGANHKYSPVEFRESMYFSRKSSGDSLDLLKERSVIDGAVILSTCNRVEIYVSSEDLENAVGEIKDLISRCHGIDISRFPSYLYIYKGVDAARHLFSVACGMDSMIPGETQILEQVKNSIAESCGKGFLGCFLKEIFYSAVSFADKMHAESKIFKDSTSIGAIAVEFIKEKAGGLAGKNILIIGAGKVIELVTKHLEKETASVTFIATRTFEKADHLSRQIRAKAARFDELEKFLEGVDIIITATRSPCFIIKPEMLGCVTGHKIFIVDLAMPRDVDPETKNVNGVELFYLEDLKSAVEKESAGNIKAIEEFKEIVDIEAKKSWKRLTELEPEPASSL